MIPKSARGADQELRIAIGRLRTDPTTWPWHARLDRFLSTKPLFETIATGPTYGLTDWLNAIRQVISTTFFTARGRAFLRWQWDVNHRGGRRNDLRRRYVSLDRLHRIRSRYWLEEWYRDDEFDHS